MGSCRRARTTKTLAERQTFTQSADAGDRGWNVSVCARVCLQPRINTREKKQKTKQKHAGQQPWRSRVREIFPCFYDITCTPPSPTPWPHHTHARSARLHSYTLFETSPSVILSSPLLLSSPLFCLLFVPRCWCPCDVASASMPDRVHNPGGRKKEGAGDHGNGRRDAARRRWRVREK